ncbi:apical endosomal glycoprotein isoform X2 [Esox lucius]|uniref:MAM domain-containing protein n=1 Tax=Esox lucius TaxID=8010 RepID=A0AAY5K726_ESOLU|nr:apical endosomal glycoprotein isoform X2 [Esox lucius]
MGLHRQLLDLVLILTFHWVIGTQRNACQAPEMKCDFFCDCTDCSDEKNCGYEGKEMVCDFENPDMCGWQDQSLEKGYMWERRQRGDRLPDSGPSSDFTTGTGTGWFMGVTKILNTEPVRTAVMVSPMMKQSSPSCRMLLRYFMWDSGHTGFGSAPLWASVVRADNREAVVWRPESTSVRSWREATIYLGRIPTAFQIRLHSRRAEGRSGDVAIDQLQFLDCALPLPVESCAAGLHKCNSSGCVEQSQVCDRTDDCGDKTDEMNCGEYWGCDFEDGVCNWDLRTLSDLKWTRTSQTDISTTDPNKGPGRDHSSNAASGHFLYVTVPKEGLKSDWTSFQSPLLEPTNMTHPCKMVMYTHQFGPRSGGLSVLVAGTEIYPVWQRGGALGDLWVKAEVEIVSNTSFQLVFVAAIRDKEYGGVAIDSIMMSPNCRISEGNGTLANFPDPPGHPCTSDTSKICDFHEDCVDKDDEARCGDFSYEKGSSGWTDSSVGRQQWMLNDTTQEKYLYVAKAPGQQFTEAQTRTPLLGPSGPACTLQFSYSLTSMNNHTGELSIRVIDSLLGSQPRLWEVSGNTGSVEGVYQQAQVIIGAREHRFQLEFLARARMLCPCARLTVKDVRFINCHAQYFPSSPTDLSCNFEEGLCGWYQDQTDNFDWRLLTGMDHSIGVGNSFAVDVWSPSLRGLSGRLLSYRLQQTSGEHCLSFYYKLYGPDTGALSVKTRVPHGGESLLWTRSGAHGNVWHEGLCPVPEQLTSFQLVFEAARSGFDGRVALDDVAFVKRPCTAPRMCSFEGQRCGYTTTSSARWLHTNWKSSKTGPKTDHTLETETGYYMMVDSDVEILPEGSVAALTSPVHIGVARTECVYFWYHMGGENPGSLTVYMKPVKGERVKIFSNSLEQGDTWRHGNGNISSTTTDWQLEFEVQGAGGKGTHVSVDDITLSNHPCPSPGTKCDLESGLCGWTNTQNPELDQLDWELSSAEAETHYTTPNHDHTLGNNRGHFLFLPSSTRDTANYKAWLLSPHLPSTKGTCLRFWAYKPVTYGSHLKVFRWSKGILEQLLTVKEVGAVWKRFDVDITSIDEYQIVFEGFKGETGVLALDDVDYDIGFNCAGEARDPLTTTAKPDNSGGIAASVIVLLLLLASLGALLYFYLRLQEEKKAMPKSVDHPASAQAGFINDVYDSSVPQNRVTVPPVQTQTAVEVFNNDSFVPDSTDSVRERQVV